MPLLFLLLLDAASGEVQPPEPEPVPVLGGGGFVPQTRSEWEAARERQQVPQQAPKPVEVPAAPKTPRTWKDPFAVVLTPQSAPAPLAVVQQLQVETPANFEASDEELAAVALVLTARVNAYRWACTGPIQPPRAA